MSWSCWLLCSANLEAIAFHGRTNGCVRSAGIWHEMLMVGFHEFAHIALGHCKLPGKRYEHDWLYHQHIEGQADAKAQEWTEKVLACNGRLYQPDFLGVVDIIRRKRQKPITEIPNGSRSMPSAKEI